MYKNIGIGRHARRFFYYGYLDAIEKMKNKIEDIQRNIILGMGSALFMLVGLGLLLLSGYFALKEFFEFSDSLSILILSAAFIVLGLILQNLKGGRR